MQWQKWSPLPQRFLEQNNCPVANRSRKNPSEKPCLDPCLPFPVGSWTTSQQDWERHAHEGTFCPCLVLQDLQNSEPQRPCLSCIPITSALTSTDTVQHSQKRPFLKQLFIPWRHHMGQRPQRKGNKLYFSMQLQLLIFQYWPSTCRAVTRTSSYVLFPGFMHNKQYININ